MVVLPTEIALANPVELIEATPGTLELQPAWLVTVANVPSEKFAVAVNCTVVLPPNTPDKERVEFCGLIVRLVTVLLLTVRVVVAVTLLLDFAVIVEVPSATPVANPEEASMVAMALWDEIQVTWSVTSPWELFPKVAVAVYCCVPCGLTKAPPGEIVIETIVSLLGKKPEQLVRRMAIRQATAHRPKIVSSRL